MLSLCTRSRHAEQTLRRLPENGSQELLARRLRVSFRHLSRRNSCEPVFFRRAQETLHSMPVPHGAQSLRIQNRLQLRQTVSKFRPVIGIVLDCFPVSARTICIRWLTPSLPIWCPGSEFWWGLDCAQAEHELEYLKNKKTLQSSVTVTDWQNIAKLCDC
jgi:hypothetical protein